jgi:two-component system response regulator NreC
MLIDAQPCMEVVGKAKDTLSAVALFCETKPDLIIMNISLPDSRGIRAIKQIRRECPGIRILILSEYDDPVFIRSALAAGGSGYIAMRASVSDLRTAIHIIYQGCPFVDPSVAGTVLDSLMDQYVETLQDLHPIVRKHFTDREQEILRNAVQGLTNREVATRLGISEKTVKTHLSNVFRKLNISQLVDLFRPPLTIPATVLIVEDDAGVRETLVEILRPRGYLVHTAATVAEAEAALRQLGAEGVQLIIADIQLTPDARAREGYALYQRWSAIYPGLPFLLMSGDPCHKDLPAVQDRAVQWLTKPFSPTALLDTIRVAVGLDHR